MAVSFTFLGINDMVHLSEAGVVGRVQSVTAPRWNSADGKPWKDDPSRPAQGTPMQYRDAMVAVEEVLFDSPPLRAKTGDVFKVRLYGSGQPGGAVISGVEPPMTFDEISGPMVVGEPHLLLLRHDRFFVNGSGDESVIRITNHYQGNWLIRGDTAQSAEKERTVSKGQLIQRLQSERARGRAQGNPNDPTTRNPLAADTIPTTPAPPAFGPEGHLPAP